MPARIYVSPLWAVQPTAIKYMHTPSVLAGIYVGVMSALHYLAGSWVLEGYWTVASAHVLCQPTIVGPSISKSASTSLELNQN